MEGSGVNTAKPFLGRNVNLHLKDDSVIVNVLLAEIQKDKFRGNTFVKCVPYGRRNVQNTAEERCLGGVIELEPDLAGE